VKHRRIFRIFSRRWVVYFIGGLFCLLAVVLLGGFIVFSYLPNPQILHSNYPWVKYDATTDSTRIEFVLKKPRNWTRLRNISKYAIGAVVVSEDWAFHQHRGLDFREIRRSLEKNVRKGRYARGASTITQQVAKNVFLSQEKTLWRKIREILLAIRMERTLKKSRILEIYLNVVEWDRGVYGIYQAANHYFDKHPSQLKPKEAAFLAMLLPSPRKYSESFRKQELSAFAEKQTGIILSKMVQAGFVSEAELPNEVHGRLPFENQREDPFEELLDELAEMESSSFP
jgi:monofunctional biosynthetic peptidoglycan transglycosylase